MERHLTAYDIFALLVPGGLAVALGWFAANSLWALPDVPQPAAVWVWVVAALLLTYVLGHILERINSSRLLTWKGFGMAFLAGVGRKATGATSKRFLGPGSELGAGFVGAVFRDLNRRFNASLKMEKIGDRYPAFMLCSSYLQQHGSDSRANVMQTLYRLCASLRAIFLGTAATYLVVGVLHILAAALHWHSLDSKRPWSTMAGYLFVAATPIALLLAERFKEKEQAYDEHFVSSTIRAYAAAAGFQAESKPGNIGPNKKRQ
jgi:hypothetical protein